MELPSIDVIIPTLNEGANLSGCLEAVFRQDYDRERLMVTVVDGGSIDSTVEIAKRYGCRVLFNEERLAEPGVAKGISASGSDLCCVLAVDNIIVNERDFFRELARPFMEKDVKGAFPLVIYDKNEPAINKYITERAEPFTEFIYMNACNTRTFYRVYPALFRNEAYTIFDFKGRTPPLLALAQAFTVRRDSFVSKPQNKDYDLLPVLDLIGAGADIAYVESALIYHHQIMSISSFIKKFRWRIRMNLAPGVSEKKLNFFSPGMRLRRALWTFYAASIIGPLIYSVCQCVTKKKLFYFYHFICSEILLVLIIWEYASLKTAGKEIKTYK